MHISSLQIERFRGLREAKLDGLARVNLLLGQNNSGKTSLLEALYVVASGDYTRRLFEMEQQRGLRPGRSEGFETLFYDLDVVQSIVFKVAAAPYEVGLFGADVENFSLSVKATEYARPSAISLANERDEEETSEPLELRAEAYKSKGAPFYDEVLRVETKRFSPSIIRREAIESTGEPPPKGKTHFLAVAGKAPLRWLSGRLEEIMVRRHQGELLDALRSIDPRIRDIRQGSDSGRIFLDTGLHSLVPLALQGDGIQRILTILAAASTARDGVVCVDELDNGLHRDALAVLWKGLLAASETYNVQIFATTHNREALTALTNLLDQEDHRHHRSHVAAFNVMHLDNDRFHAARFDMDQLDFALDHGLDVRA